MALPRKIKTNTHAVTVNGRVHKFAKYSEAEKFADQHGGARVENIGLGSTRYVGMGSRGFGATGPTAARTRCLLAVMQRDGEQCYAADLIPEIECSGRLDGHELVPRGRGGDDEDPENVRIICRGHHDYVHHRSPARGVEVGLVIPTRPDP